MPATKKKLNSACRWAAAPAYIENGYLPLRTADVSASAAQAILLIDPSSVCVVLKALRTVLACMVTQRILLTRPVGRIRELLIVPSADNRFPHVFTRLGERVVDVTELVKDDGHRALLPGPVLPLKALTRWAESEDAGVPPMPMSRHRYRCLREFGNRLSDEWIAAMAILKREGVSERDVEVVTAHVVVPVMDRLMRDATALVGRWIRGVPSDYVVGRYGLCALMRRRNMMEACRVLPSITVLHPVDGKPDGCWERLEHAIERGRPLIDSVMEIYGLQRRVVNTLRFGWEVDGRPGPAHFLRRLRDYERIEADALPVCTASRRRLDRLLDSPIQALSQAVLSSRSDGTTAVLRRLLGGDGFEDLKAFADVVVRLATACGSRDADARIDLSALIGRPNLGEWLKNAREWRRRNRRAGVHQDLIACCGMPSGQAWTWPVPFRGRRIIGEVGFRALRDADALEVEGRELEHCIALHADACVSGRRVVLHADEGEGVGSTLMIEPRLGAAGLKFDIVDLRGLRNQEPAPGTLAAAQRLVAGLSTGEIPASRSFVRFIELAAAFPAPQGGPATGQEPNPAAPWNDNAKRRARVALRRFVSCLTFVSGSVRPGSLLELLD